MSESRTTARRRARRLSKSVWHIVHWEWAEPDAKYLPTGGPTPLQYIKTYINSGIRGSGIHRREINEQRRAILEAGGPALYGIYRLLCEFTADSDFMRGYLVDRKGLPASPELIAETFSSPAHLNAAAVSWALRKLSSRDVGLLERVDWAEAHSRAVEARERLAAAVAARAAAVARESDEDRIPTGGRQDTAEAEETCDQAGSASPRYGMDQPRATGPPGQSVGGVASASGEEKANANANGNSNSNGNGNGCANGDARTGEGVMATGNWHQENEKEMATGQPPDDGGDKGLTSKPPPAPSDGGMSGDGGRPPATGRARRLVNMQTNKPSDDGGGKGLTASPSAPSDSTRDPIRMGALLSDVDEKYRAFSDAVYVRLRMPLDMNIRERKRQRGVFSSRLRGLLEMARGLHSQAGSPDAIPAGHPDQWPQWLVDFVGKRLRKASSLAGDPEYGQPDKVIARAKMWTADFAKTQDVLLQKHCGPADLTIGEDQ